MPNHCVKTGARVLVVEYGGVAAADLFLVGNAIVARFGCGHKIELDYSPEAVEHASHRLTLGQTGWYRDDLGVAVAPIGQLEGPLVHPVNGRNLTPAEIAARLAPLRITCPECGGGGSLTISHSSQDPQLEHDVRCPRCGGDGEIELTQEHLEELERDRAKLARLTSQLINARYALRQLAREMRERKVNHGTSVSGTLVAWAARIEANLAGLGAL